MNGHKFTEENTYLWKKASGLTARACRTCNRRAALALHHRRKPALTALLTLALALLLAAPLAAQQPGAAHRLDTAAVRLDGGAGGSVVGAFPDITDNATTDTVSLPTLNARNVVVTALATPTITSPLVVNGTPGATTYGYKRVSYLADGTSTAASAEVTIATGNATLDATNSITISWPAVTGSVSERIYRTTGGAAPPKLIYTGTALTFTDTGAAGTAQTPATANTTGVVTAGALVYSGGANAGEVLTADANGRFTPQAGGGGITNSAGANVIPKSDGTNLVASTISDDATLVTINTATKARATMLTDGTGPFLDVTGTLPASPSAAVAGIKATVTAAGSAAFEQHALNVTMNAGYTGASRTAAGMFIIYGGSTAATAVLGNFGAFASAAVTNTVGANVGFGTYANNSNANGWKIGTIGVAGTGASNHGIGVLGMSSGSNIGVGMAAVLDAAATYPLPAFTRSMALLADNVGSASAIMVARDNGTEVFSVEYAGYLTATVGSAGNARWGVPAASPQAYTHGLAADSRAGTDTNVRGAKATDLPGNGTGTGGSGMRVLQTAYQGSTGTAANTPTDRIVIESLWAGLTESAATNFSKLTYGASTAVGGEWLVTISANDGTEYQSLTSRVRVSSVRKATGNTVSAVNVVGTDLAAVSSGTLTATFTVVEGAAGVTLAANAVSSLTQIVLRISYQAQVNGPGTVGAP